VSEGEGVVVNAVWVDVAGAGQHPVRVAVRGAVAVAVVVAVGDAVWFDVRADVRDAVWADVVNIVGGPVGDSAWVRPSPVSS
jgi:hypothetical protein